MQVVDLLRIHSTSNDLVGLRLPAKKWNRRKIPNPRQIAMKQESWLGHGLPRSTADKENTFNISMRKRMII